MKTYIILLLLILCTLGCGAQTICNPATTELAAGCPSSGLASIGLSPTSAFVVANGTQVFSATGFDGPLVSNLPTGNNVGLVTNLCVWSSSTPSVATFLNPLVPILTGVGLGTTTVSCTIPAAAITSQTVTVTGQNQPLITNPVKSGCANPCPLPSGQTTVAYSDQFTATDNNPPLTWDCNGSCAGLFPTGLTLTSGGLLSGTPSVAGTSNFTLRVTDNGASTDTLPVTITISGATCGPPGFLCSNSTTNNANLGAGGVLTPIFSETSYDGTASISTGGTTVTWVSSPASAPQGFPTTCPVKQMTLNNTNVTINTCPSSTSLTIVSNPSITTGTYKFAICEPANGLPGCQNATANDTTLNPSGIDTITELGDITTPTNGQSYSNITCSGGANNPAISSLSDYIAGVASGGNAMLQKITLSGSPLKLQVVNTGVVSIVLPCTGGFGMAPADDQVWFYMTNNSGGNATLLAKTTWNSAATATVTQSCSNRPPSNTTDCIVVDFGACPGVYSQLLTGGSVIENNSEMALSANDDVFAQSFGSVGTQGFNYIEAYYQVSTGKCRAVNLYTGDVYDWCSVGSAGDSCATEAPLASKLTASNTGGTSGNTCWGIPVWKGQATVQADGKTVTLASGSFGFGSSQTLSLHVADKDVASNLAGFNCTPSGIQCQFAMSSVSGGTITLSSATTAAKLAAGANDPNCATTPTNPSLPCTVNYAVINGIHGVQLSGDGGIAWASFGAQGGWGISGASVAGSLGNACAGSTQNTQVTYIPVFNTTLPYQTTQWGNALATSTQGVSGYQWAGHPSQAYKNVFSAFYAGPNYRSIYDLTHWTIFSGSNNTLFVDSHGTKPLYVAGTGATPNDNAPWFQISDSPQTPTGTGACGNPSYCPTYLNLEAFAWFSQTPNTNPVRFFHNFNCGNASGARCNDGAGAGFEEVNSISYEAPNGTFMIWGSSMLHSLGIDQSNGKHIGLFGGVQQ